VKKVEVSATGIRGTMTSAPVALIAPKRTGRTSGGEGVPVSNAQIKQMVEQMQSQLDSMHISLQYSFYGAHGEKVAVQVINRETGQVVREIPAKEMQALQNKIGELVGMIFNDNA
jgi:flagellar protein FlaG